MKDSEIIARLFLVLTELDARECSNNCPSEELRDLSWEQLCDLGTDLFNQLKNKYNMPGGDK